MSVKTSAAQERNGPITAGTVRMSFYQTIPRRLRIPYPIFWILVFAVLYLPMFLTARSGEGVEVEWFLPWLIAGGGAYCAIALVWCSKRLRAFSSTIELVCLEPKKVNDWLTGYLDKVFSNAAMLVGGVVICTLFVLVPGLPSKWGVEPVVWYDTAFSRIYFFVLWGCSAFVGGSGAVVIFSTMWIPVKLSRQKLRMTLHSFRKHGVHRVGKLFSRFAFCVLGAAIIGVLGCYCSPVARHWAVLAMGSFMLSCPTLYFLFTLLPLHQSLADNKADLLNRISLSLEERLQGFALQATAMDPHSEERVERLLNIRKEILAIPEWPVDIGTFAKTVLTSLGPLILAIVQCWDHIVKLLGFN